MAHDRRPVEVVVSNADHPNGLGTARAVSGPGVRITGLCREPASPCCRSRAWDRLIPVTGEPEVALATLLEIGESPSERRVLIPASDEVMHLVSRNRDALARHYGFVLPPPDVVDLLLEKTRFHVWASHQGFAVPETHIAETEGELAAILRDVRYPVVLKPLSHTPEWEAKSPNHKVYKLYSREDLDAVGFPLFEAAPQFIVQRWIEGGDDCVHFCLTYVNADGREAGVYTGRKYLQWPPQVGSTAICVGEENPNLLELTRAVWRAAGFRGLGSVEAKYCAEDGRYYIIEPTVGRNNLQSYVAVAGGVNMTRLALEDALGRPTVATCPARSAVWINEPFAVLAVREAFARRKPERRTLRRLFTSRRPVAFAHVRWTDPFPFVALLWENLRRLGASLLRRTPPVQPPEGPVAARSTEADVHEMTGRS